MGGFPSPFPTGNPYISQASEFGSGAAHLAGALREAAVQQQALKQQADEKAAAARHQDANDLATALHEGAVPVSGGPGDLATDPATGKPTLRESDATAGQSSGYGAQTQNPDYSFDPRRTVLRGGVPVYYPTPEEKDAVEAKGKTKQQDDTNSFVLSPTAAQAMNEAGYANVKPGDRIPMAHAAVVTEAVKAHLGKSQLDDSNSVRITQDMADRLAPHGISLKPGARVALDKAADLKALVEMGEGKPPAAAKELHWDKNENDAGDVTLRALDPETGKELQKYTYAGEGHRKKDPDAPPAEKPPGPAQFRLVEQNKQKALKDASAALKKDLSEAITPEDKTTANQNYRQSLAQAQNAYESEISTLTGKDVPHNDWADTRNSPPPKAATNGQQTGKKPPVTMQHVRNYAQQKKITEAQAIREFKQYGYTIGGE